eukprot:466231-Ditylum_brightwellii.AAC.1
MDLIDDHVVLLQYAHDKCYLYEQWKNPVNMVIAKVLGINKIHCLRVLTLYEADYSICMGLIWKELIKSFQKRKSINRGLHGGGQGHDAQAMSLIEKLKYNICYSSCKLLINFDNDAASRYDRILPCISSLIARKKGHGQKYHFCSR